MRKVLGLLLALLLTAASALGETFTAPEAFSLTVPDGWSIHKDSNLSNSSPQDGFYYLGELIGPRGWIQVSIQDVRPDVGNLSLYKGKGPMILAYREAVERSYTGEDSCAFQQIVKAKLDVPFLVFQINMADYGQAYCADTVSGGWRVSLWYYNHYRNVPLTQADLDQFVEVVASLTPILP